MKQKLILFLMTLFTLNMTAQVMDVRKGSVSYRYNSESCGEMTYDNGTTLTIGSMTYTLSELDGIDISTGTTVEDNTVTVDYDGAAATVVIAGNIAPYVTATVSGAHVTVTQSTDVSDDTCGEITYTLSGTSTDGAFNLSGSYKATVELNGLTLTNPSGAPLYIEDGKRIDLSVKKDTENTLTDGSDSSDKGCVYCKGHLELKGKGTLNIYAYGTSAHGIKTGDYCSMKNCTVNILAATKDGLNCNQYFLMESGEMNICGSGDDGIQVSLDDTTNTGETTDHEDEDSGNFYLVDGTLSVSVSVAGAKAIKTEGIAYVRGGTLNTTTSGGVDDSDTTDLSKSAGIKSDIGVEVTDGTLTFKATGAGNKCINSDGYVNISGGNITMTNSGTYYSLSSTDITKTSGIHADGEVNISDNAYIDITISGAGSKGIKADTNLNISGGTVTVTTSGATCGSGSSLSGCSAIKGESSLNISGGTVTGISTGKGGKAISCDGAINISGGTVTAQAKGSNYSSGSYHKYAKGMKSDGNMVISGGTVNAYGASHEGIESKGTLVISDGKVFSQSSDDAINSAGDFTISGGYVCGYSTGNDGMDANGNFYIKGGTVYAIGTTTPEVAIDANTEQNKQLYFTGGTLVAIGGLESGSSISQTCYQASWSKNTWYALYNGSNLALAFKTPSSGGTSLVVSTSGTTSLKSGVSVSGGTELFNGMGYINTSVSGGSSVSLSSYSGGGNQGGPGGNQGGPGGGGRW